MSDPYLGAGTKVSFDVGSSGSYTVLTGCEVFPAVGDEVEAKAKTTVSDDRIMYGAGMKDSPDFSLEGQYEPNDADQQAFIAAVKARKAMKIKLELPQKTNDDGSTTDVSVEFDLQPLGYKLNQIEAGEWLKYTVTGKQASDAEETITNTPAS